MTYFLKIFGTLLAIAATVIAAGASLAVPMVLALKTLPSPYSGITVGVYCTVWFCAFMAVAITFDTWDERDET